MGGSGISDLLFCGEVGFSCILPPAYSDRVSMSWLRYDQGCDLYFYRTVCKSLESESLCISVGDFWGLVLLPALYNGKISQRYDKMACGDSRGYVCGISLPHGDGISGVSSHVI